jgi:hypothetical protein
MKTNNPGIFTSVFSWFHNEIHGQVEDQYVNIKSSTGQVKAVVPFVHHDKVPDLGHDREYLIKKAEKLFPVDVNDTNRLKWLQSVHKMQEHKIERIMKVVPKGTLPKVKYHKWGLVMQHIPNRMC